MKSKINYHLLNDSVIVSFSGQRFVINKNDHRFNKIVSAIKDNKLDNIPNIVSNDNLFNKLGLELKDEELFFEGEKLPNGLSQRVLNFAKEDLPFEYLIKFFKKLKKNPSFNSRQMLYKFLEHNGHPITQEGNFIAYRGVTEDFKDCHTRTFDNSIGAVCEMPRQDVDDNPNNTCSNGLHVACYDYAKSFGARLVEVEVNPVDVVAVPVDYNGTKMRVSKFKVLNVCDSELQEDLYDFSKNFNDSFSVGDEVTLIVDDYAENFDFYRGEYLIITEHLTDIDKFMVKDITGDTLMVDALEIKKWRLRNGDYKCFIL